MLSDDNDVAPEFLDMAALKYSMYCKDAMSGACGKTAKFWMIYCHLVDLCLLFHGEMKSCDVDLSLMCCMTCQRYFSQQINKKCELDDKILFRTS